MTINNIMDLVGGRKFGLAWTAVIILFVLIYTGVLDGLDKTIAQGSIVLITCWYLWVNYLKGKAGLPCTNGDDKGDEIGTSEPKNKQP